MIPMSIAEIAAAIDGTIIAEQDDHATLITGNSQTDSREVQPGEIFFARRGEETDGHRFVDSAVQAGAALVVAERDTQVNAPHVIVQDATIALGALATEVVRRAQRRSDFRVVGITGSNGKTTTKNLVAAIASRLGETVAAEKSFNNEVGGPVTMLRTTETTETLVAEMGASARGEISRLTAMAPPNIGVVLSVGYAHVGEFGGIEQTFLAKREMVEHLRPEDVAVLNIDDPRVASMSDSTQARVRWFGLTEGASVRATDVVADQRGTSFTLHIDSDSAPVRFSVLGEHHVMNALAAAAVGVELGASLDLIRETLESQTRAAKWRMEVLGSEDIVVINDAYNASPDSMKAALKTLAQVARPDGRTVAVLGAMSELGEYGMEAHAEIGTLAVRLRLDQVVVVGREARQIYLSTVNEGAWSGESVFVETMDEAKSLLLSMLRAGDTVLVKSSNSAGLRHLGDQLGEAVQ